jgi:glycosyltransferase involved in cell wall biosynthesis
MNKEYISIISPVYNEQDVIQEFIERVYKAIKPLSGDFDFEVILINDASRDNSLRIMKDSVKKFPNLRVIDLRRNYGQTYALQCGIDAARGDIIISLDSDLQHFPEEISAFIDKIEEGYDVVCGWRHKRSEGVLRRWPSAVANALIKKVSKVDIHDFGTTFRAYRADLVKELRLLGESHRYIPALLGASGCAITEIPIKNIVRPKGKSNYGINRTFGVFLDILLLHFISRYLDRPLRAFGKISLGLCFLGFGIFLGIVISADFSTVRVLHEYGGWFTLSVLLLLGSLQVFLTGIISEILTRVHYSLNDQAVYRIRKEYN